jgi:chromosome segregation ATPase
MKRALALCVAAAGVPACTTVERLVPVLVPPGAAAPAEASASRELFEYMSRLRGLNDAALSAEAMRARQATSKDPSDVSRVKAGIAMSLSREPDEGDIVTILEPVARRENGDPEVRAMASFLQANAQERRRLRESAATARATLRDERRAMEAQKQRVESLQERAAQLQQKLDALTELEKSLSDRQAPTR